MRKEVLVVVFLMGPSVCCGYVPEERLFGSVDQEGVVLSVRSSEAFYRDIINNESPVVAKLVGGVEDDFSQSMYRDVASLFASRVVFTRMSRTDVSDVIRMIMVQLGITQVALPLYFFFKSGTLILPLVAGVLTKDRLAEHINKKFFPAHEGSLGQRHPVLRLRKFGVAEGKEKRCDGLGEKLQKWFSSLQNVSREVKAYQLSRARKRRKEF
ncbi:hypothetical protein KKA53_04060 [Candidatus Dependentiae bacterium]|nr:hypothetical protein [Candidatus Dependentiae bacterium]